MKWIPTPGVWWVAGAWVALAGAARAQTPANDGFQRRNGQMQVLRNGQPRPMTHDAHLPTGVTVTKDGFLVTATGQRTELREGQGCDLRGRPVAVLAAPGGGFRLAAAAPAVVRAKAAAPPARSVLQTIFGSSGGNGNGFFKFKKSKKHHGKGKGHGRWKGADD